MNTNIKIAAIALVASLVGGTAGATLSSWSSDSAAPVATAPAVQAVPQPVVAQPVEPEEQVAEADIDDMDAVEEAAPVARGQVASSRRAAAPAPAPQRAAAPARSSSRSAAPRQVNYDYSEPRTSSAPAAYTYKQEKTFWQKHRDPLTVGIGAGAGALIGGLSGGKKGAWIGTAAGAGGAALYTYKMRKRNNN
jgi:hypothetical protein